MSQKPRQYRNEGWGEQYVREPKRRPGNPAVEPDRPPGINDEEEHREKPADVRPIPRRRSDGSRQRSERIRDGERKDERYRDRYELELSHRKGRLTS